MHDLVRCNNQFHFNLISTSVHFFACFTQCDVTIGGMMMTHRNDQNDDKNQKDDVGHNQKDNDCDEADIE